MEILIAQTIVLLLALGISYYHFISVFIFWVANISPGLKNMSGKPIGFFGIFVAVCLWTAFFFLSYLPQVL